MRISLRLIQSTKVALIYKDVVSSCLCDNPLYDCAQEQIDCKNCLYINNPYSKININTHFRKEANDFYISCRIAGLASKKKRYIISDGKTISKK